jgi:hypothetical protein
MTILKTFALLIFFSLNLLAIQNSIAQKNNPKTPRKEQVKSSLTSYEKYI